MADGTVVVAVAVAVAVAEHPQDGGATAGQLARIAEGIRARRLQVRWVMSASNAEAVFRTENPFR
ncbi:hypothetical protein [Streptomyces sp. TRM72054]|uniref:hypothetical protein n=1 Tax=Streptomyces sp. TRM72054 TaxID=2870562 RepID=UPI0021AB59A0|nr:hypothetical protein [Streptomyces sp. TRM72054]